MLGIGIYGTNKDIPEALVEIIPCASEDDKPPKDGIRNQETISGTLEQV